VPPRDKLEKMRKKWYKKVVDPEFDTEFVMNESSNE
jgi:hypothetical protein